MRREHNGIALFVDQVRQTVQAGTRTVTLGTGMSHHFLETWRLVKEWKSRRRWALHSFEWCGVCGAVFIMIEVFEERFSLFFGACRLTIQTFSFEQLLCIFVRIMFE